jgi:NADH dehydrogenase
VHRLVIVGAGFGGLHAARALVGQPVEVTVVDQRNFHTFQPLLYEVSTAGLDPGDVAYPVRAIFGRAPNVTFRYARVTGVDWERRCVLVDAGEPLPYDSLVVATGATARFFGIPGAEQHARPLYTLADARALRDHVLRRLEEIDVDPERADGGTLTFVVVGGGPTGVEVAGALAELLDVSVRHDGFRFDRERGRIVLVDALDRLLTAFDADAARYAAATLEARSVELRLGRKVRAVTATSVELLVVDEHLRVPGRPGVFAVGDAAAVLRGPGGADDHGERHGELCPQLAQVAIQSGRHAAAQVLRQLTGQPLEPFRYRDKGIMATIGRRAAITQLPSGLVVRGTLGWLGWLALHLVYLVGFRNRVTVLVNWSWRYLSWTSGPRIIVGEADHPDG